ncbi:MAG: hypothetical protein KCHDKBKB_00164 [Elusimicrobia bacterium]|nr:hypothetical protein [Elusimicrobiota bacterium]
MKPNKKDNARDVQKEEAHTQSMEPLWQPTWKWHLKVLAGVYVFLIFAYFAVSTFLSKVPPPYRLREIPKELTPWMK